MRQTSHLCVCVCVCICMCTCTVKPPKKGHVGDKTFDPCREVVPFSEVLP